MCCLFCPLNCPNAGIVESPICLSGEYDEIFGEIDCYGDDDDGYYDEDDQYGSWSREEEK